MNGFLELQKRREVVVDLLYSSKRILPVQLVNIIFEFAGKKPDLGNVLSVPLLGKLRI